MRKPKVIIADPNQYFRMGLRNILQNMGNVEIIGEAANCEQLHFLIQQSDPDLVFLDFKLPEDGANAMVFNIKQKFPGVGIIILSEFDNHRYVRQMMDAGTQGYLAKNRNNLDYLHEIIRNENNGFITSVEEIYSRNEIN